MKSDRQLAAPHKKVATPAKPYPSWPMWANPNGQWCRKHKGKPYYFGSWRGDWKDAEKEYNWRWPHIEAGRPDPKEVSPGVYTTGVHDMDFVANWYANLRLDLFNKGKIGHHAYFDSKEAAEVVLEQFGKTRLPESITPYEWGQFRLRLEDRWGACKLRRIVGYIRSMSSKANGAGLIPMPFQFGVEFPNVSRDDLRADKEEMRRERGEKLIPFAELPALWKAHTKPYDAFFLLGLNGGFQACDCSALPEDALVHEERAIDFGRVKTAVPRYIPLWKETYEAIIWALSNRPKINEDAFATAVRAWELRRPKEGRKALEKWEREKPNWHKLVFITRNGVPYVTRRVNYEDGVPCSRSAKDVIGEYFGDLLVEEKLNRRGIGFATLRHNFYTRAKALGDVEAARFIMGHRDASMGEWYDHLDDEKKKRLWVLSLRLRKELLYPTSLRNGNTDDLLRRLREEENSTCSG